MSATGGNVHRSESATFEVMDLNSDSLQAQQRHAETLRKFESKKRARTIMVPTAVEDVKARLRELGHPITLFGEGPGDRRERLREVIASLELGDEELQRLQSAIMGASTSSAVSAGPMATADGVKVNPKERGHERILETKKIRESEELQAQEDSNASKLYQMCKDIILNSTQYGDERPLTSVRSSPDGQYLATGSLSATAKIFDIKADMSRVATLQRAEERVAQVAWHPMSFTTLAGRSGLLACASADGSCVLWTCGGSDSSSSTEGESTMDVQVDGGSATAVATPQLKTSILHELKTHQGPVLACDFHPSGSVIGTASADYTWRLWDVQTGAELLVQDGHSKECSAISFQEDGALVATADYAGVVAIWDIRSGQQVQVFQGHIKKLTSICFNPNGFQVVSGGTDNTVRIWDLRKKKCGYVLPAHLNIVSDVRISKSSELMATASFDGTIKIWGTRDYTLLQTLSGHVGKVMSCDFLPDQVHIASAGFDRTVKLWAHKDEF